MSSPALSGQRFRATYIIAADTLTEAQSIAEEICVEQTVELPMRVIKSHPVLEGIVGHVESLRIIHASQFEAVISYAIETSAFNLPQLMNVVFGNSSMKKGIRLDLIDLPDELSAIFRGPRFGRRGLRELIGADQRPLLCTALKPMGASVRELAELAYQFALGGIDLIKDDHGLNDQPFAPFRERVAACSDAIKRANQKTGMRCMYILSISGPIDRMYEKARYAKEMGAGGLMIIPGIMGFDTIRMLAEDDSIGLPLLSHPAWNGGCALGEATGFTPSFLYGELPRLAGADGTIFAVYGGRFSFSKTDCLGIVEATGKKMGHMHAIFPIVAGGMTLERIPELINVFGRDQILLISGALYGTDDLVGTCQKFREMAEQY